MKVEIFGPYPYEFEHLSALLQLIPPEAKHVIIQAPYRRDPYLKACQRPNTLEYVASIDNSKFIFYSHHPTQGVVIKSPT